MHRFLALSMRSDDKLKGDRAVLVRLIPGVRRQRYD